ncbi:hypothetical protein NQZ68_028602, partial [Dissostichus eleginoides]
MVTTRYQDEGGSLKDDVSELQTEVSCPVSLIVFSYMRILRVCFSGCKQSRQKAVSTCAPHLASLINFSFGVFFEIVQS